MDKIEKDILDYKIAGELTWVPWATNFKNTLEQVQLALESIGYTIEIKRIDINHIYKADKDGHPHCINCNEYAYYKPSKECKASTMQYGY